MKIRYIFTGTVVFFLLACGNQPQENTASADKKEDTAKASESIRSNMSLKNDMDALEKVFSNDNWQIIDKKDTSYFYFSRLGDLTVNTYQYKIIKGDSAQVIHSTISPEKNDITWKFDGHPLQITSATKGRAILSIAGKDSSSQYEFIRTDDDHLTLTYPDKRKVVMKKMLPLSLFLVRSFYDYGHGTKMAFDKKDFTRGH